MTESQPIAPDNQETTNNKLITVVIAFVVLAVVAAAVYFYLDTQKNEQVPVEPQIVVTEPEVVPEPIVEVPPAPEVQEAPEPLVELPEIVEEPVIEETPKVELPLLDNSDNWIKERLSSLTWRKELLRLVIDDDMVRRLVVFTDNFAQGLVSYEYSPLAQPQIKFSATKIASGSANDSADDINRDGDALPAQSGNALAPEQWLWDEAQTARFKLYVDLLRSFEPEQLATWYFELKPLIDQAYAELGYEDQEFTQVLQDAVVRVLDMEFPSNDVTLIRPSVMYKYADKDLEQLPQADKLLLRVGKGNLLVIKSFLLEFSDALSRAEAQQE
ncbi:DUF3014 domain-containing protein [Thalassotalea euphylliae]|uniref:DUF3014 domain-containing protein n=1 Tax=Thalassotalea euphylliae TaxID=1655234 RepID=A0A3E0TSX8_9GAMM|nr:DUF3014 domain-containing protein [Thalassotalea euphylliae]REL27583.1 DUF3014 domain-containing protein [Thalassotalea euphylliae]